MYNTVIIIVDRVKYNILHYIIYFLKNLLVLKNILPDYAFLSDKNGVNSCSSEKMRKIITLKFQKGIDILEKLCYTCQVKTSRTSPRHATWVRMVHNFRLS